MQSALFLDRVHGLSVKFADGTVTRVPSFHEGCRDDASAVQKAIDIANERDSNG